MPQRRDGHQGGGRASGGRLRGRVEAVQWIALGRLGGVERAEEAEEARDGSAREGRAPILAAQTSRPVENWRPAWNITETSELSLCPTTLGTQACGWGQARSTFLTTASEKRCDLRAGGRASSTCDTR